MTTWPAWYYDDLTQIGRDFTDLAVVAAYDQRHRKFRDVDGENAAIVASLGLGSRHTVADFGSGTGAFVLVAARTCARVYAVDISQTMLDYTRQKAESLGLTNVVYCHGSFLTYEHSGPPLDAVVTSMALHHLADFWKQTALCRLNGMLTDGGRLCLADVVFGEEDCARHITAWIAKLERLVGPEMAEDITRHIRKEHSTYTWIMEGLLERAGFRIDERAYQEGVTARYFCTKVRSVAAG